jgi:DsbC/DsbD-like thiol-disulfide interchange protein
MSKRALSTIAAAMLIGVGGPSIGPTATLSVAWAQDASDWDAQPHTAARLIAGSTIKNSGATLLRAGIEIKLDPGWHTYWRDPGDSGAPPKLDFSGSDNVKSVTVLWPAPQRFPDGAGGHSIGYFDHLILPLRVEPANTAKPSSLQLKLDYDVCDNICVPVESDLKLSLSGNGAEDMAIEKAEVRVPRRVALGRSNQTESLADMAITDKSLAILSAHRVPGDGHDRVVVEVAAPAGAQVDLFAEGPTPDWSLPLPEQTGDKSGTTRQFTFDLDGLPPNAHAHGATLTLTAVSGDDAIEVPVHLD